jgi:cobalt-zinc-cadmium efflux system membrane fusion protein
MNRGSRIAVLAGVIALLLDTTACQSKSGEASSVSASSAGPADTASAAPAAKGDNANTVDVDPKMMANIRIEPVREQTLHRQLTTTGKVQFNEDRMIRVLAPLPGQVVDLQVRVGDSVRKDQLLFSIKSREVAALVTEYLESQRDLDLAAKTHTMTKDLFDHQAASRIALQQAESDLAKAQAHVARAEEALQVVGLSPQEAEKTGGLRSLIPVPAPQAGKVIERAIASGQFVQADSTALLTLADMSTVWVFADVFESDIHLVHPGDKVRVIAAAYPDRMFMASVDRINDKVDPETRTLKVRLLVSNPGELLKAEMFITAALELNERTSGVTIPAKALLSEDDKSYLFVASGERRFERRLVSAVPDGSGRMRVTDGLHTGDRIVTDGALLLRLRQQESQH